MASSDSAPFPHPGVTNSAPLIALVPLHAQSVEGLAAWLTRTSQQTASRDLRFCLCVATQESARIHNDLAGLPIAHEWIVLPIDALLAYPTALAEVAIRYPGSDIIQICADADLPYAWDARLCKGAYALPTIAVATAMCDVSAMFALIDEDLRPNADAALVDRTAYAMGNRSYYDVPRVHSQCTFLRRAALDSVLPDMTMAEANPQVTLDILIGRLRAKGWSCVLCDYLYVGGTPSPAAPVKSGDEVETSAFLQNHPLGMLRRAVNAALRQGIANVSVPGLDARPVQLHVTHFWGGGLDKWVRDFARADTARINLVFSSFRIGDTGGQRLVLYSSPADPNPIRAWDIAQPIRSTLPHSIEYRRILEQIISEFSVESIIVSSLIGHTLDALDQPIKTLVVCHDYYPICQAINPQFDTTCERCTLDDLRRCAKSNPLNSIFVDQTSEEWHEMRNLYVERLLANRVEMVAPSPSVIATMKRLAPRLESLPMHLIPHGIDLAAAPLPLATRTATEPLRIVVLGRLSVHKGTALLREACADLLPYAEITLVGCGGNGVKLATACNWNHIEKYQPEELSGILRKIAPHAGLLASVIPETFSYTLSELNQLGIPAIATALGSFNDRIVHGESGFLFKPTKAALIEIIQNLHTHPALLAAVATRLSSQQSGRSVEAMVNDYRALIPVETRAVARFAVGIGMQTGLTEPYRQLTAAYAQISQAYADTAAAYNHTKVAYDHAQSSFSALSTLSDQWADDYDALQVENRWWHIPRALRLMAALREKINAFKNSPARIEEAKEIPSADKE